MEPNHQASVIVQAGKMEMQNWSLTERSELSEVQ